MPEFHALSPSSSMIGGYGSEMRRVEVSMATPRVSPEIDRGCGTESANVEFLGMNAAYLHPALKPLARVLTIVRLPIVALLLLLEPVVNVVCGAVAVLGLLAAVAFELSAVGPRFPFLQVTAISLAFGVLLILYHSAIALLVRD